MTDVLTEFLRPRDEPPSYAQYTAVANALAAGNSQQTGRPPLKVAVLRNFTVEPLLPVLPGEIFRAGFHPAFYTGDFDAVQADVLNPASPLYAFEPDFIIVAQWLETLRPAGPAPPGGAGAPARPFSEQPPPAAGGPPARHPRRAVRRLSNEHGAAAQ